MIKDIAKSKRLKFFKAYNVVAKHLVELNWKGFFKYRLSCGEGMREYYKRKGGVLEIAFKDTNFYSVINIIWIIYL